MARRRLDHGRRRAPLAELRLTLPPGEPTPALGAEAVALQVVVPALGADEPARRHRLRPAVALAPVPVAVLRPQHPLASLEVLQAKPAHRGPGGPRVQVTST